MSKGTIEDESYVEVQWGRVSRWWLYGFKSSYKTRYCLAKTKDKSPHIKYATRSRHVQGSEHVFGTHQIFSIFLCPKLDSVHSKRYDLLVHAIEMMGIRYGYKTLI